MANDKHERVHAIEHQLQQALMQRQTFSAQQMEIESALKELDGSKKAYKIVGNIMVDTAPEDLVKDLKEKKHMVQLRMDSLNKQEEKLRKQLEELKE